MENSTRKRVRENSTDILYEDDRYLVGVSNIGEDSHHLVVNDIYAFLDRGILGDLAKRDTQGLRSGLRSIGADSVLKEFVDYFNIGDLENEIEYLDNLRNGKEKVSEGKRKPPLGELGWALSKALVRDGELYAQYLRSEAADSRWSLHPS